MVQKTTMLITARVYVTKCDGLVRWRWQKGARGGGEKSYTFCEDLAKNTSNTPLIV